MPLGPRALPRKPRKTGVKRSGRLPSMSATRWSTTCDPWPSHGLQDPDTHTSHCKPTHDNMLYHRMSYYQYVNDKLNEPRHVLI